MFDHPRVFIPVTLALIGLLVLLSNLGPTSKVDATQVAKPTVAKPEPLHITKVVAKSTNKVLTYGELVDELSKVDLVFVGEQHDSVLHHQMQLQIIKSLYALDENLGVGMEMFQRPYQSVVDRYFSGRISEDEFLKQTEYAKRWGYDWQLYRAIVEYARRNEIPLAALNAPAELTKRVKEVGYDNLTDAERKELGPVDFNVKAHRDFWLELLSVMHGTHQATPEQKERSYQVMAIWDDYMAQSAAHFRTERKLQRMVILAGGGHVEGGFGIPDRAAKYASATKATVRIVIGSQADDEPDALATDYVIYIDPPQAVK
jgi:Uncharacterized iron-regulated protein